MTVDRTPRPTIRALRLDAALLAGGDRIAARTVELPDYPGVWAVGDCAWILDAKTCEPCPPTAQHAIREAKCLAGNIAASIRGTRKKAFSFNALGKMGSLGHRSAVAEVFGLKISGFLAWWLWRTVYLMKRSRPGDVTLRTLGPGECFGEIALVSDSARTATVRSRSSVNLLAVDRDAFHALFTNLPPLRGFFEQLIGMRSQ